MDAKLYIKNMVCDRCKSAVGSVFRESGVEPREVALGYVVLDEMPSPDVVDDIRRRLERQGFELLEDNRLQTVDRIKTVIIEMLRYDAGKTAANLNVSALLSDRMHSDYSALSKLFSAVTGTTIEKFVIAQKVEMVKELISYGEMSLTAIADRMGYSSVAYLSSQFKAVTGMTPSAYKNNGGGKRIQIDKI